MPNPVGLANGGLGDLAERFYTDPVESNLQRGPAALGAYGEDPEVRRAATAEVLTAIVDQIGQPTWYGGSSAGPVIRWRDEHRTVMLARGVEGLQLSVRRTAELEGMHQAGFECVQADPASYFRQLPYLWRLSPQGKADALPALPAVPTAPDWWWLEESLKALLRSWWEQLPAQIGQDVAGFNIVPRGEREGTFSTLSILCSQTDGVMLLVDDRAVRGGTPSEVMAGRGWRDRIMGWWQRDFCGLGAEGPAAAARMAVAEARLRGVLSPADLGIAEVRCEGGGHLALPGLALHL